MGRGSPRALPSHINYRPLKEEEFSSPSNWPSQWEVPTILTVFFPQWTFFKITLPNCSFCSIKQYCSLLDLAMVLVILACPRWQFLYSSLRGKKKFFLLAK